MQKLLNIIGVGNHSSLFYEFRPAPQKRDMTKDQVNYRDIVNRLKSDYVKEKLPPHHPRSASVEKPKQFHNFVPPEVIRPLPVLPPTFIAGPENRKSVIGTILSNMKGDKPISEIIPVKKIPKLDRIDPDIFAPVDPVGLEALNTQMKADMDRQSRMMMMEEDDDPDEAPDRCESPGKEFEHKMIHSNAPRFRARAHAQLFSGCLTNEDFSKLVSQAKSLEREMSERYKRSMSNDTDFRKRAHRKRKRHTETNL